MHNQIFQQVILEYPKTKENLKIFEDIYSDNEEYHQILESKLKDEKDEEVRDIIRLQIYGSYKADLEYRINKNIHYTNKLLIQKLKNCNKFKNFGFKNDSYTETQNSNQNPGIGE